MGLLYDILEYCESKENTDELSVDDLLKQYPQYNTEPTIEEDDKPTSMELDSE